MLHNLCIIDSVMAPIHTTCVVFKTNSPNMGFLRCMLSDVDIFSGKFDRNIVYKNGRN